LTRSSAAASPPTPRFVAVIKTLNREIDKLEQRLHQCVRLRPEFRLLTSVPGIGPTLATLIMLEVGTIERFAAVGNFASYARCVDGARISNGKKKGQGNVKNGNAYLAWAFVEAANFAQRYCAEARRFYRIRVACVASQLETGAKRLATTEL
jgi:transposase